MTNLTIINQNSCTYSGVYTSYQRTDISQKLLRMQIQNKTTFNLKKYSPQLKNGGFVKSRDSKNEGFIKG